MVEYKLTDVLQNEELISMTDENLIRLNKNSVATYSIIFARYYDLVCIKSKMLRHSDFEVDDLMQEGFLGLFRACETFNEEYEVKFSTYANVCITNSITTAISKSSHCKQMGCIDIDDVSNDVNKNTPESIVLEKEKMQELYYRITNLLSDKEWMIFRLFLTGCSYEQISRKLNLPQKVIDNALQRVRRKLKSVWIADK